MEEKEKEPEIILRWQAVNRMQLRSSEVFLAGEISVEGYATELNLISELRKTPKVN